MHSSGATRREKAQVCVINAERATISAVIARESGRPSIPLMLESKSCDVPHTPLEPVIGLGGGETRWRTRTVCDRSDQRDGCRRGFAVEPILFIGQRAPGVFRPLVTELG